MVIKKPTTSLNIDTVCTMKESPPPLPKASVRECSSSASEGQGLGQLVLLSEEIIPVTRKSIDKLMSLRFVTLLHDTLHPINLIMINVLLKIIFFTESNTLTFLGILFFP